jgi:hypothetical protein
VIIKRRKQKLAKESIRFVDDNLMKIFHASRHYQSQWFSDWRLHESSQNITILATSKTINNFFFHFWCVNRLIVIELFSVSCAHKCIESGGITSTSNECLLFYFFIGIFISCCYFFCISSLPHFSQVIAHCRPIRYLEISFIYNIMMDNWITAEWMK